MNRLQERASLRRKGAATDPPANLAPDCPGDLSANERPRVHIALRSDQRETEVRIRISWCYRLSGPAAARLLIVVVLVVAATAAVTSATEEFARDVLCSLAGFLAGSRPRGPRP
jgi:hypothetical protein